MQKLIKSNVQALLKLPLFSEIKEDDLLVMLDCLGAFIKDYKKDEYIYLCNEDIESIGIILSGKVQMIREDMWGNKTILVNMISPELFGETSTCGSSMNATVSFEAVEESTILFVPFKKVMNSCPVTCEYHHKVIKNMVTLIADKNVRLMQKIDVTSKKTLREKIAAYLTLQAEKYNSMEFNLDMGRVQFAHYLNADRSAVTRELNQMAEEGLIEFHKNSFRIIGKLA